MNQRLLNSEDARHFLRISRRKLFQMIRAGQILPIRFGRVLRFDPRDLEVLVEEAKLRAR